MQVLLFLWMFWRQWKPWRPWRPEHVKWYTQTVPLLDQVMFVQPSMFATAGGQAWNHGQACSQVQDQVQGQLLAMLSQMMVISGCLIGIHCDHIFFWFVQVCMQEVAKPPNESQVCGPNLAVHCQCGQSWIWGWKLWTNPKCQQCQEPWCNSIPGGFHWRV